MIAYRHPTLDDAHELAAMVDELNLHEGDPTGNFTAETALRDVIAADAPLGGIIAVEDDRPIGFALWHFGYETAWAARGAYMTDLYVRDAARGRGVGHELMRLVARETRDAGGRFVWWTAYRNNVNARAFYNRIAFEEDGVVAFAAAHEAFDALIGGA